MVHPDIKELKDATKSMLDTMRKASTGVMADPIKTVIALLGIEHTLRLSELKKMVREKRYLKGEPSLQAKEILRVQCTLLGLGVFREALWHDTNEGEGEES